MDEILNEYIKYNLDITANPDDRELDIGYVIRMYMFNCDEYNCSCNECNIYSRDIHNCNKYLYDLIYNTRFNI